MKDVKKLHFKTNEYEKRVEELCSIPQDAVLLLLDSRQDGLSSQTASEHLRRYGLNVLSVQKKHNSIVEILLRFKNPLVIQLLVIMTVSLVIEPADFKTPLILCIMILVSVFLACFQEKRSTKAADNLKKLVQTTAIVIRDKTETEISMSDVVPGDIVQLSAGSIIPADLRILSAKDFFVSQSALTGESLPVEKTPVESQPGTEISCLQNACFQGSTVVSGTARGVVINTGKQTFLGTLAETLADPGTDTDFDRGIREFVWLMIRFMLIMVSITFLIVGLSKHNWLNALLFSISVAVGLTPEMLPMIITVCLSKGALFMAHKRVIVKKLKSIQNLGAMDILCTDKTGTITQDKVTLEKYTDIAGRTSEEVLRYAYMNSYYQTGLRNLLDLSVLSHEHPDIGNCCRKVDEIPFDFERKRMSVVINNGKSNLLICKGAVDALFEICNRYQIEGSVYPMTSLVKTDIMDEYTGLSSQGYRVLAIACRSYPESMTVFSVHEEEDLILLGYLAFLDPPKDSAKGAIASLRDHGVRVKILTGDNELVTRKVCEEVGLTASRIITGKELEHMGPDDFTKTVCQYDIFAHLSPDQKESIIKQLRTSGHVVGYMGDGINDAGAMKIADVGISVDTAVDVARESADIILLEKNLLVLEDGIIEGRKTFNNIVKYIKMGASSNFGNMFSVVGASYLLPFLPMQPIQILTNNLLYDISQTGIPLDTVDPEFSQKPQKWDISFIRRFMMYIGPISSLFDFATFALMWFVLGCSAWMNGSAAVRDYTMKLFNTGWFVESLLTQTLIVHIIRTNRIPFLQSRASLPMTLITMSIMAAAVIIPYSPVGPVLGMVPLPVLYWPVIIGYLAIYIVLTHLAKTLFYRRYGT